MKRLTQERAYRYEAGPQGSPWMMRPISCSPKARIVVVRTFPCMPRAKAARVAVSLCSAKMKESESHLGEEGEEGGTNSASTAVGVRTVTMLPSRVRCSWSSEIKVHPAC